MKCDCCGAPHQDEIRRLRARVQELEAMRIEDIEDQRTWQFRAEDAEAQVEAFKWFVARERALRDAQGKGGQHTGHSPSISPSVLKELERIVAMKVGH